MTKETQDELVKLQRQILSKVQSYVKLEGILVYSTCTIHTKENMERDANKDFYKLYKEFAIGAIPKLGKIPGFLLKKPLKKRLADCDESVLKSLAASMKTQDNRPAVGQITVPVTYFYADPGSLFSPALADWYKEHVVTPYKAVCFPKSTHMLVIDYPEKFAEEVSAVLRA